MDDANNSLRLTDRARVGRKRTIALNPEARIVCGEDALHVIHRRGVFDFRARGLTGVHQRLEPLLDGRFTRNQLLAAAGGHAGSIAQYLNTLHKAGVLSDGRPPITLPKGFPQPHSGTQVLRVGRRALAVTLAGAEAPNRTGLSLSFVSRSVFERQLVLQWDALRSSDDRIWVICDDEPNSGDLARRAAVARHLLGIELGRGEPGHVGVFHLASSRTAVRRLTRIDPSSESASSVAEKLKLISMLDCDQLPLSVWAGDLGGLSERRIAYGLDARELLSTLTAKFLARRALIERTRLGAIHGKRGYLGKRASRSVRVQPEQSTRATLAYSHTACASELVGAWALGTPSKRGRAIDVLAVMPPSRRAEVLQGMLRHRAGKLPARVDDTLAPLVIIRTHATEAARVGFEEALCEVLLRELARDAGLDVATGLACAPSLEPPAVVRRRLRKLLARLPQFPAVTGRIRAFGSTFFFGIPLTDERPPHWGA